MPEFGDLVPARGGGVAVHAPDRCPNGHELGPRQGRVSWAPCSCKGHTCWSCNTCGAEIYGPPLGAGCEILNGPARVRTI